jgi:hypothetical protein
LIKHLRRVDARGSRSTRHGAGASRIPAAGCNQAQRLTFTALKEENHEGLGTKDHPLFVV